MKLEVVNLQNYIPATDHSCFKNFIFVLQSMNDFFVIFMVNSGKNKTYRSILKNKSLL